MSTDAEFRRIQEQTEQASARLNALRKDLNSKLEQFSVHEKQHIRENIRLPLSPAPVNPTRLASIAASLSPSNHSSPGRIQHFPINTPPTVTRQIPMASGIFDTSPGAKSFVPESNILTDYINTELESQIANFERSVDAEIDRILTAQENREKYFENFLHEISDQEKQAMSSVIESIRVIGDDDNTDIRDELVEEGMAFLRSEFEKGKLENEKIRKIIISDKFRQILMEITHKINPEIERLHARVDAISNTMNSGKLKEEILEHLKAKIESDISSVREFFSAKLAELRESASAGTGPGGAQSLMSSVTFPTGHHSAANRFAEENAELKKLIRKMKISLSKWRIDYLRHAESVAVTAQSVPLRHKKKFGISDIAEDETAAPTPIPRRSSPDVGVVPGTAFGQLSESLMRMWSAVPPSSEELVQFLVNMEACVGSGGKIPISSVYEYECRKNTQKLPIAQLAAQREFIVSKDSSQDHVELHQIENELLRMIFEYEKTYNQKFVFNTADEDGYAHCISSCRYERSTRDQ